jgi:CDP-paratose 2-epimerase
MSKKTLLVTGSAGLIGSEAVRHFSALGWCVHGVDNNMRADFFGADGDTSWNLHRLQAEIPEYRHHSLDIRDRAAMLSLLQVVPADMIVHAAAQPSHDLAASRPFDDFDVNAVGTLNLLESTRRARPEATFAFLSTNKVYGDAPNELPLVELETRWEYGRPEDYNGIREDFRIDQSKHSLFGASKVAADVMVQEYGRYFDMQTLVLRGGCLTGAAHSAAELHGFLAYLARAVVEGRKYRIFGYKGKQVRDNIASRAVCRAIERFHEAPRPGAVYNIGGGRGNSISMLEAITKLEAIAERKLDWEYVPENRAGDHICYISDLSKLKTDYPSWDISISLDEILVDIVRVLHEKAAA